MQVILIAVGNDRPGLTNSLATAIVGAGGNWLESHFARLGGKFVGSVLVDLPGATLDRLENGIAAMRADGFDVTVTAAGEGDSLPGGAALTVEVVGVDQPGIIRAVSAALATLDVNILELQSRTEAGAMSGERLFRARARTQLPEGIAPAQVRKALERISGEIMVDFED